MFLDSKEIFLLKQTKDKGAAALYDVYVSLSLKAGECICDRSINYLKAFLQYHYQDCIRVIRSRDNKPLTLKPYDRKYLTLIQTVAAYHLDRKEIYEGLTWALKTLRLFEYIYPTRDNDKWLQIFRKLPAAEMLFEYSDKIDAIPDNLQLDWETRLNEPHYANDNY